MAIIADDGFSITVWCLSPYIADEYTTCSVDQESAFNWRSESDFGAAIAGSNYSQVINTFHTMERDSIQTSIIFILQ